MWLWWRRLWIIMLVNVTNVFILVTIFNSTFLLWSLSICEGIPVTLDKRSIIWELSILNDGANDGDEKKLRQCVLQLSNLTNICMLCSCECCFWLLQPLAWVVLVLAPSWLLALAPTWWNLLFIFMLFDLFLLFGTFELTNVLEIGDWKLVMNLCWCHCSFC